MAGEAPARAPLGGCSGNFASGGDGDAKGGRWRTEIIGETATNGKKCHQESGPGIFFFSRSTKQLEGTAALSVARQTAPFAKSAAGLSCCCRRPWQPEGARTTVLGWLRAPPSQRRAAAPVSSRSREPVNQAQLVPRGNPAGF